jgi:ribosomal protein S27AE
MALTVSSLEIMIMRKGICPKCGSSEVYSGADLPSVVINRESNSIPITRWGNATLENYVCGGCGYVESYLHNQVDLKKVRETWPRVDGQARR